MILSGLKACLGSTKEVRILPHFLHSASVVGANQHHDLFLEIKTFWAAYATREVVTHGK